MQILNHKILFSLGLLASMSGCLIADNINPSVMAFNEGQTLTLPLSGTDINRMSVVGDQITDLRCMNNSCGITYDPKDTTGSAYVSLNTNQSFTMFISTHNGHNFSILVNPQAVPGETYLFQPMSAGMNASGWEKNSDYEQLNVTVLSDMMNNEAPDGYGDYACTDKTPCTGLSTQTLYTVLKMTPVNEYLGDEVIGIVYSVKNIGQKSVSMTPSAFYTPGVRSISLSQQTLVSGDTATVYEVITNPNAGD